METISCISLPCGTFYLEGRLDQSHAWHKHKSAEVMVPSVICSSALPAHYMPSREYRGSFST